MDNDSLDKAKLLKRLWEKSIVKENHWLWTGGKTGSFEHGAIKVNGINTSVNRISLFIHLNLDLEDKLFLACHKLECKYKNCWNPDHLYIGTFGENLADSYKLGRTNGWSDRDHCQNGHEFNEVNSYKYRGYRVCKLCTKARGELRKQRRNERNKFKK